MQNCYAVIHTIEDGTDELCALFYNQEEAVRWLRLQYVTRHEHARVVEVALVPVKRETPTESGLRQDAYQLDMMELRHEIRTLRTLLTALNGRVAELSGAQGTK